LQYRMSSCSTALVCTLLVDPIYFGSKVAFRFRDAQRFRTAI
jgi:hypothetical protein